MAGVTRDISTRVRVTGAEKYKKDMKGLADSLSGFKSALNIAGGIGIWETLKKVLTGVFDLLKDCVNESVEFDDAMTGVAKTTTMNAAELEYFRKDLLDLSEQIPTSASELAQLAETAGQLGIADENILNFVRVMADLGYSTNLSANEAATALARFANIMGTSPTEYENMGSAIVDLGNNFATTESEIVDMSTSLAGFTVQAGMSEADTFALATALSSVGIEAEAGSTAMGTLTSNITKAVVLGSGELDQYAKAAGMSAQEFAAAWEMDSAGTLAAMIENLNGMQAAGVNILPILDDMGIKNARQVKAFLSLVSAGDLFTRALERSNTAYEENTALSDEASKKYANNASQIQIMKNEIENQKIALGDNLSDAVMWGVGATGDLMQWAREIFEGDRYDYTTLWGNAEEASEIGRKTAQNAYETALYYIDSLENLDGAAYDSSVAIIDELLPGAQRTLDALGENATIEERTAALRALAAETRDTAFAENELTELDTKWSVYSRTQEDYENRAAAIAALRVETAGYRDALEDLDRFSGWDYRVTDADRQDYAAELADMGIDDPEAAGRQQLEAAARRRRDAEYAAHSDTLQMLEEETVKLSEEGAWLRENAGIADEYTAALKDRAEELGVVTEAEVELSDVEQAANDKAQKNLQYMQELQDNMLVLAEGKMEAINKMMSGFAKIEPPKATTVKEMDAGLQSQLEYMDKYVEMLDQAQAMGIGGDLLAMLSDGSETSYAILEGLVAGGEDAALDLQAKYEEVQARKNEFAMELAQAEMDMDAHVDEILGSMDELVENMNQAPEAYSGAYATVQGAISGIDALLPTLTGRSVTVRRLLDFSGTGVGSAGVGNKGRTYTSHAAGLEYVPYDDYPAMLHRGEMVLTALEARAYRSMTFARSTQGGTGSGNTNNYTFGDVYVREEEDTRRIAKNIARLNKRRAYGRGQVG